MTQYRTSKSIQKLIELKPKLLMSLLIHQKIPWVNPYAQVCKKYYNFSCYLYGNLIIITMIITMRSFVSFMEGSLPSNKLDVFGKGGLLMSSLPYYLLAVLLGFAYLTIWDNAWIMVVVIYVLLPYLDELFTLDVVNPTESQRREL